MWICFNHAFVSAVQDRRRADGLVVRARKREHLTALFPSKKIYTSAKSDYIARVYVSKREFATMVVKHIGAIDYDNFKSSVVDHSLGDLYTDFWQLHREYQDDRVYQGLMRYTIAPGYGRL